MISLSDRVENIVGKEENAGYQHFLFFPQCFQKASFSGSLKVGIVWQRFNKQQLLRLVQTESMCRRQNKCNLKTEILLRWEENMAGKGNKRAMMALDRSPESFSLQN